MIDKKVAYQWIFRGDNVNKRSIKSSVYFSLSNILIEEKLEIIIRYNKLIRYN